MRTLIVTNRGPFEYVATADCQDQLVPGEGGVATALRSAASYGPTTLLCSPMTAGDHLAAKRGRPVRCDEALEQQFVELEERTYGLFYGTFANQALWLLQHGLLWPPDLAPSRVLESWSEGYEPANLAFAEAVLDSIDESGTRAVMFHDYHFYLAPLFVRNLEPNIYLQHFIHIPWPQPADWRRLPSSIVGSICEGLRSNDSVVFQTRDSARNFLLTCREYLPAADIDLEKGLIRQHERITKVWSNPISIDPEEISAIEESAEFQDYKSALMPLRPEKLIVRVDRLDPSKNIVRGFQAYEDLLNADPCLRGKVQFLAFLVPSRTGISLYEDYSKSVLGLADSINLKYGTRWWQPIHLVVQHNRTQALVGLSVADVVLVNSIADGMNLVAKEAALINKRDAALVLSQTTGAYDELRSGAIGIDPFDTDMTAAALRQGLSMEPKEREARAIKLKAAVLRHDLTAWYSALLADINGDSQKSLQYRQILEVGV